MGLRESIKSKPWIGGAISGAFVVVALAIIAATYWPEKKAKLDQAFYSDDDGQTWFSDSAYLVPPFQHDGKTAVVAQIYSYADGSKKFCAYLTEFTPEAKQKLEAALADAKQKGQQAGSVALYHDRNFMQKSMLVKKCGASNAWVPYDDPKATDVMSIKSPDGSLVDQVFVY
jgi:hypothetical protein